MKIFFIIILENFKVLYILLKLKYENLVKPNLKKLYIRLLI